MVVEVAFGVVMVLVWSMGVEMVLLMVVLIVNRFLVVIVLGVESGILFVVLVESPVAVVFVL